MQQAIWGPCDVTWGLRAAKFLCFFSSQTSSLTILNIPMLKEWDRIAAVQLQPGWHRSRRNQVHHQTRNLRLLQHLHFCQKSAASEDLRPRDLHRWGTGGGSAKTGVGRAGSRTESWAYPSQRCCNVQGCAPDLAFGLSIQEAQRADKEDGDQRRGRLRLGSCGCRCVS